MRLRKLSSLLTLAVISTLASGAEREPERTGWDSNVPHGPSKTIRFTTETGTWLDLDVSPDGKTIVFSMLGDLYLLAITGGDARRITSGLAWDVQPRFSPDGLEIAFTSDRAGGNNLWRIPVDGGRATQVTNESFRLLNNPAWTPDGQYLIGRKHFTGRRSLGAGELWMYHRDGGSGIQLTSRKNDQQDQGEPAVSSDGRYLYFSEDVSPGPNFQYNKDPHKSIYAVKRLELSTGRIATVADGSGGAVRPQPSPDGKHLAFVRRIRDKTVLCVADLQTGAIQQVWNGLSRDMQETWAIFGPYANYAWTPDSSSIVVWAQGKIWRVPRSGATPAPIHFRAQVEQTLVQPLRFEQTIESGSFHPKMIRSAVPSPDHRTLVFHALGTLWIKRLPDGEPRRLTASQSMFEYDPQFRPDGRKLLYTTWQDATQGAIVERDLASGKALSLTAEPGFYYNPRYSPDGKLVVYTKSTGTPLTGDLNSWRHGVYILDVSRRQSRRIADAGRNPHFSADGQRVYFQIDTDGSGGEGPSYALPSSALRSIGLHGEDPRDLLNMKYANFVSISPNGEWVAFTEGFNSYLAPLPRAGRAFEISKDMTSIPVIAISKGNGTYLSWSADSSALHWIEGTTYRSRRTPDIAATLASPAAPATPPSDQEQVIELGLTVKLDTPTAVLAFTDARLITMRDANSRQEIIENGTLLLDGDTIEAIGAKADVPIPAHARIISAKGKTIVPGYVDVHAHANHFHDGVVAQENWTYYANLAYGVTTIHDPAAVTDTVFSHAELIKAGSMVGPRVYSTGASLFGANSLTRAVVDSLSDAEAHVRRTKSYGAFSVKSYNQPRREQRQQIYQAARELNMLVVEEGGSTFNHDMTMILDGVSSVEHNLPVAPLYDDVITLWKNTEVNNTPAMTVLYGGLAGMRWWAARSDLWKDGKLNRFFPPDRLNAMFIRREIAPEWDYHHLAVARTAKQLRDAGVNITVGGHGEVHGISTHWEMWMLAQGGFTNWEVLRAATIDGARLLGLSSQIGSLERGKRADFVVLNSDPLADMQATADTRYVAVNGRLFDVDADLREIGGKQRKAPTFYWQRDSARQSAEN